MKNTAFSTLELEIINRNFTVQEVENSIDYLKNKKSPGIDNIPAEFIKGCKLSISQLTNVLNYIIEQRDFPDVWSEGIRSAIFKSGRREVAANYRGITILPIFEKVFEIVVHKRLQFVNEAYDKVDRFNGGFLNESRTTDNLFILNGLIQRQLLLGQPLYICFVDFSKAFDLVNRNILFYKILKMGWNGRVIDTLRSLYSKTSFRVKHEGKISSPVFTSMGVNQGGIASGFLFRKYMSDLYDYLKAEVGVCMGSLIILYLLWADDLILISNSVEGLQRQLDGLFTFCSDNHTVVNEIKTNCMAYGNVKPFKVFFNGNVIEQVMKYKYLGNMTKAIKMASGDTFGDNYKYLCDQARKAIFSLQKKLRAIGKLPPKLLFHAFDTLIKPILIYGSDVWGISATGRLTVDKVFFQFMRCAISVKATTSNVITLGECGRLPPSVGCQISVLCFLNRLHNMAGDRVVKQVFLELSNLNSRGFNTWVTQACELAQRYKLDVYQSPTVFKQECKTVITNIAILRIYCNIKDNFH